MSLNTQASSSSRSCFSQLQPRARFLLDLPLVTKGNNWPLSSPNSSPSQNCCLVSTHSYLSSRLNMFGPLSISYSCHLPHPCACSHSTLQTIFLETLHPDMDATLHVHRLKDRGEIIQGSCKSEGEDFCRNTTASSSSSGEFWTLLVAKLQESTITPPGNSTLTSATLHSRNCAVYSVLSFVHLLLLFGYS